MSIVSDQARARQHAKWAEEHATKRNAEPRPSTGGRTAAEVFVQEAKIVRVDETPE